MQMVDVLRSRTHGAFREKEVLQELSLYVLNVDQIVKNGRVLIQCRGS